ncbi:uncharacterized protein LOC135698454 [Ochlerotatus camptorhynchus]|uniref:uncharacterized protein LOC135698454 n=1 Tax=Ochlerotatus camptorhynchus TaxID=644619 RepID=UPI0031D4282D
MELRIVPVIQFVTIVAAFKLSAVSCVPMKYEIGYRSSIDLDTEQTEARYDQGMLADIINDERPEMQKAESCVADNFKYDHGQKILRYDPCEICLCIDGEIFCWWKQCDVPSKPDLNDSPLGSGVQLTTPVAPQSQPAATDVAFASSSTRTPPPSRSTDDVTTTTITTPISSSAAPSYPDQPDNVNVRIVHPQPPPENIPQNILSFPQSPPIMMYRPAMGGKNATSLLGATTATERNKHGGPLKKVKPLHLANGASGKKPFRKSKSKGYVINYGHIEGGLEDGSRTRVLAVTERIPADGMRILNDDGRAFQGGEGGGGLGMGSNDDDEDENESDDEDHDEGDEEDDDESGEAEGHSNLKAVGNSGENFGGFGFGMIKEPEDDKQQHYIITSSGHVEMFDDNSMEATENAFGMNRLPSMQHQQQPLGSTTTIQPMALVLGGTLDDDEQFGTNQATSSSAREGDSEPDSNSNRGGPIPPLITLTTNVTQHSNYSSRFSADAGGSPPLTPFASLSSSSSFGSVIDVLNSTVDGDYLDDNQTELIYPAVPGLSGGSSSSGSYRRTSGGRDGDGGGGGLVKATTTTSTASSVTADASSTPELHCVVMGVSYKVGAVLKQETGNCLHCVCVAGPESEPVPRVTCTPLNCPPLILPDILDGAGF